MTIEEIFAGESKNIEFKESLPDKSIKYMKSVAAFANGTGGKIIFGIADSTNEVVGIDKEDVFKVMDAIANAISDSCEPAIIPDITLQTIQEKTVIIVEIASGRQRPYYIRSLGRENGVYVRVAGTTRPADEYMIKELLFEGSNRCFDQALCSGLQVTDADISRLCRSMKAEAVRNARDLLQKTNVKNITRQQLLSWGILIEKGGKIYPSNAYAVLNGCDILPVTIQCGVFKGTTKAIFVDRREYTGPLWEQIEQAYQFVLRNIRLGAVFEGIYRQDVYEIPPDAIRELIINAAVHRSYLEHGNIQIAVYDDRLEITSPGKLPMGQTIERMKEGYSKIRNEAIAYAFSYMNLIEHWGSGIPRIILNVKKAGLKEPEFIGGDVDLRINIYRQQDDVFDISDTICDIADTVCETSDTIPDTDDTICETSGTIPDTDDTICETSGTIPDTSVQEQLLLALIMQDPAKKQKEYASTMKVSVSTTKRMFARLQEIGILTREGTNRRGRWIITDKKR